MSRKTRRTICVAVAKSVSTSTGSRYLAEALERRVLLSGALFPGAQFPTGPNPDSLVTADFNGDGKIDLAVANSGNNTLSVLLNSGGGTFTSKTNYVTGSTPQSVTSADFNGDGKPDIAVANRNSSTLTVLMNNGSGTFTTTTVTSSNPSAISTADFNSDGKADIAVVNNFMGTVNLLLSNGNGTFAPTAGYTIGSNPVSVSAGDFNGDGKADLAVGNYGSNNVSVLLNNGSGIFSSKVDIAVSVHPSSVTAMDLNGDGKADLAVANNGSNTVSVLLSYGNGSFAPIVDYSTGSQPRSVTAMDLNADGKADLVVANYGTGAYATGTVSVLLNAGNGTFAVKTDYDTGLNSYSVTASDLSGDGKTDLAVANYGSNTVSILLNNGSGTFAARADYTTGSRPRSVTAMDFNTDGNADLAVANLGSDSVSVLLNNGDGTFASKVDYSLGLSYPTSVTAADFNGDGKLDLAVASMSTYNVSVLLNNGNGTFAPRINYVTPSWNYSVTAADCNGDGKADLAVANASGNSVSVLLNNGDGTFAAHADYATGSQPWSLTAADFNDDGKADLAVANGGGNTVSVLLNDGNGTFAARADYATGSSPQSVTAADFNGDGNPDLAVTNYDNFTSSVSVLLNNGNGAFVPKTDYATGSSPQSVTAADFNGDGKIDLAIANNGIFTLSVLLNNGDGTFAAKIDYSTDPNPQAVTSADFNGDGKPDLAVANGGSYTGSYTVSVLLNMATFAPSDLIVQNVTFNPSSLASGGAFNIGARIRNTGLGPASATTSRLRLSVDQVLTLYDKPLSPLDVSIPAIAAGSYYDYTGTITVPAGTPPGQYYVGVFADAFNVAGQSDITNDAGLSATAITVTPVGLAPVITQQPLGTTVDEGASWTLTVQASEGGALLGGAVTNAQSAASLRWQWYRDGKPIKNANGSQIVLNSLSLHQAGSYTVEVSNSAGLANSTPAIIAVNPVVVPLPSNPGIGQLIPYGITNPNWPTIVITHGWQKPSFGASWDGTPPDWIDSSDTDPVSGLPEGMASAIQYRLAHASPTIQANVVMFLWREAYTVGNSLVTDLGYASSYVDDEGRQLVKTLGDLLRPSGQTYTQPIQFIGHSLGTMVNAWALEEMGRSSGWVGAKQVTILDDPFASERFFQARFTNSTNLEWVDNYYGGNFPNSFGGPIGGAAPSGGLNVDRDHAGVHQWYFDTINDVGVPAGFDFSIVLGSQADSRPNPLIWVQPAPTQIFVTTPSQLPQNSYTAGNGGWSMSGNVSTQFFGIAGQTKSGFTFGESAPFAPFASLGGDVEAASMMLDVTIPAEVTTLSFDYAIPQTGDGDWLTVYFNGSLLFSRSADSYGDSGFQTATIPVSEFAGQTGVLKFALHGVGAANAQVSLANINFLDEKKPSIFSALFQYQNQQEVSFQFTEDVSASLAASDLLLVNQTTGQTISNVAMAYDADTNTARFSLPSGVLPDGNYRATFSAGSLGDGAGNLLFSDFTFDFFILGGDANHDAMVDIRDLYALATNWQGNAKVFSQGDYNYDGKVDAADLGILARNWQKTSDGTLLSASTMPAILSQTPPSPAPIRPATRTPIRMVNLIQ